MKILITGASGYLAGRLLEIFENCNLDVQAASRNIKKLNFVKPSIPKREINWKDKEKISQACEKSDVIIHAAGPDANYCKSNTEESYKFYSEATKELIRSAITHKVRKFIFFSTIHVYSNSLHGMITEDNEPRNDHPYAQSKLIGEKTVIKEISSNKNMSYHIIRLSNGYGCPSSKNIDCWKLFVNNVCRQAIEKNRIEITNDRMQFRDFIPMKNICSTLKEISLNTNLPSGVYNLGSGKSFELYRFAELVKERIKLITGNDIEIFSNNNSKNYKSFTYEIKKLEKLISLEPINHKDEIDHLIKFCLQNFKSNN